MSENEETGKSFSVMMIEPESQLTRKLNDFLAEKGLSVKYVTDGKIAKDALLEMKPDFVVIDLVMTGFTAFQCLELIKTTDSLAHTKVIVTSKHNSLSNVKSVIAQGASDYVVKPYDLEDMVGRMAFQVQKKKEYEAKNRKDDSGLTSHFFSYVDMMLREATADKEIQKRAYNLTRMLAMTVKAVRISLIQCHEDRKRGVVRASNDDANLKHLEINIARYPEVQYVMNQEKIVVLENLANDPMMGQIKQLVKSVSFNSMVVAPVFKNGQFYGVLSTRFDEEHQKIANTEIKFCDMVANMLTLLVSSEDSYGVKKSESAEVNAEVEVEDKAPAEKTDKEAS